MKTSDHSSEFVSSGSSPGDGMPRGMLTAPPIRTTQRKRGKSMSRRKVQNPKLRVGTRNNGESSVLTAVSPGKHANRNSDLLLAFLGKAAAPGRLSSMSQKLSAYGALPKVKTFQ
jgi:hypothetical protein